MTGALAARLARFPRVGLATLPTPLEPMPRLSAHLGGPSLWVKRDDLCGPSLGSNELRKLDVVVHDALQQGADTLVSGGVVQSNSQRQVAAAAAKLGLACHLAVYHGRVAPKGAAYATSGNALLNRLFGAVLHDVPWTGDRNGAIATLVEQLRREGRRPFLVPYGVSSPLGAVGYASAAVEIATQAAALAFTPSAIVFCSGSGATQAGLAVAASACPCPPPPRSSASTSTPNPTACAPTSPATRHRRRRPARPALRSPHAGGCRRPRRTGLWHPAPGHARRPAPRRPPRSAGARPRLLCQRASPASYALLRAGRWRADEHVVFVHTGGAPSLFAHADALAL